MMMAFSLRPAGAGCAAALGLLLAAGVSTAGLAQTAPIVRTHTGPVQGVVEGGVAVFKGIPFAAPPVGPLRWRAPQPAKAWTGVRPATEFGPDCTQRGGGPPGGPPTAGRFSEDCLFVNVWRSAQPTARKLPVMVWIYGGGLQGGGSSRPTYGGPAFAKQEVVFVNFNYRLGQLGFFAFPALSAEHPDEPKGNYGFMDQIAALAWVKRNIAAFGGDPDNVTIFGESSGGASVHAHLSSPLSKGLFHKAIIESGGVGAVYLGPRRMTEGTPDFPSAETIGVNLATRLGVTGTDSTALARLRAVPAADILTAGAGRNRQETGQLFTAPIIDGKVVTDFSYDIYRAGKQHKVPLIVGANSAEAGDAAGMWVYATNKDELFAQFGPVRDRAIKAYDPDGSAVHAPLAAQVAGDRWMAEPAREMAGIFAAQSIPTYHYRFSYVADAMRDQWKAGAPHGSEIPYVFDTLATTRFADKVTPRDAEVARIANRYWVNFARTGDPNGPGLPPWPRYDVRTEPVLDFRADGTVVGGPDPWKPRLDAAAALNAYDRKASGAVLPRR